MLYNHVQDIGEGRVQRLSSSSTANIDTDQSGQTRGIVGLELIDDEDDNDLPLPMGMAEVISNRAEPPKQAGKVEQLDDDNGPEPPAAMLEASLVSHLHLLPILILINLVKHVVLSDWS